jgi:hypothetical protein
MSKEKRNSLTKKERASAVAAKRKHDPNPERKGPPINVSNFGKGKISEDMENLEEKNVPTSPEKWAQAKAQAKSKFDVYPSAYANGWASKKYKEMGGGWKSVAEESENLEEGRPSQRHPLEGHEYHKKSDEALIHIAKDAHKAAEAMKSHNTDAENKYRDQANDSATVRHFRKTSGMPDWYKKKYGHMKESFRPMDEPKYNLSIQARQKKADDNKLPFDGPYKKSTGVVTDKSGAKHGPMSIARHLARMAAKKQANVKESTEPLQESRKAEIVREAMKIAKEKKKANSEDKFIADPELNSKVIKTATQM